jgi:MFS family permease
LSKWQRFVRPRTDCDSPKGNEIKKVEKEIEIERIASQKGGTIRRILGIGLAGFFFGMGDGIVAAILPVLMAQIGSGAAALGLIEGCGDAAFHLVRQRGRAAQKGGWKTSGLLGGALASLQGFLALTLSSLLVFLVRSVSGVGRGLRALIPEADLDFPRRNSRTVRFYRTMERSGTVLGPTLVLASIGLFPLRDVFLLSFPLSLLAIASLTLLSREAPRNAEGAARSHVTSSFLPRPFYLFFVGAGIFRIGNVAVSLVLLRAYELLWRDHGAARAANLVVLLYIVHQILYAVTGVLITRSPTQTGKKRSLTLGYFLIGLLYLGFIFIPPVKSYVGLLPALFFFFLLLALGGAGQSLVDLTERPLMVVLLPESAWERGERTLDQIRAIGAFLSSMAVGLLWSAISPTVGFLYAGLLSIFAGIFLLRLRDKSSPKGSTPLV